MRPSKSHEGASYVRDTEAGVQSGGKLVQIKYKCCHQCTFYCLGFYFIHVIFTPFIYLHKLKHILWMGLFSDTGGCLNVRSLDADGNEDAT